MNILKSLVVLWLVAFCIDCYAQNGTAPAPLFRDPITDGAADPVMVWNRNEKTWWMLYTQRRANCESEDVAYCYGNAIGIASSADNGHSWVYRGTLDLKIDNGHNTFWAPDIVWHNGKYHLFAAYIEGVYNHWGGTAHIAHFVSKDLWKWKFEGFTKLSSDKVIDPTLLKRSDGMWQIWYKDEVRGSITMTAVSKDLKHWKYDDKPAVGDGAHEGAKVFRYKDYYWMITDEWHGMRVYRSDDLIDWEKQGLILETPSDRLDDHPSGAHGDVVVAGESAYVIYFTHPGRSRHTDSPNDSNNILPFEFRRSSIQVAPLIFDNGTLTAPRNKDFDFYLPAQN